LNIIDDKLKVAVLMGCIGRERVVSIQSGQYVSQELSKAGLEVVVADITPDNLHILEDESIDVFFNALHGRFGEDGRLQQILEDKSVVYTGSKPEVCKLAFNKLASKKLFAEAGMDTPAAIEFHADTDIPQLGKQLQQLGDRYVVKPVRQGSSVGISILTGAKKAITAGQICLNEFGDCMIEEFIAGREITVGILENKTLPIIEIRPKENFYNYYAKYIDEQTEFLFDTINDEVLKKKIESAAMDCFNMLGCRHFARVDFILDNDGKAHVLELNVIPGLTTHSLLPRAAAKAGLSMSDLCVKIVKAAMKNKNNKASMVDSAVRSKE